MVLFKITFSLPFRLISMLVLAFSLLARIWGECSTIHSLPAFFFKAEISSRTLIPLFIAMFSPQWLSGVGQLWPNGS